VEAAAAAAATAATAPKQPPPHIVPFVTSGIFFQNFSHDVLVHPPATGLQTSSSSSSSGGSSILPPATTRSCPFIKSFSKRSTTYSPVPSHHLPHSPLQGLHRAAQLLQVNDPHRPPRRATAISFVSGQRHRRRRGAVVHRAGCSLGPAAQINIGVLKVLTCVLTRLGRSSWPWDSATKMPVLPPLPPPPAPLFLPTPPPRPQPSRLGRTLQLARRGGGLGSMGSPDDVRVAAVPVLPAGIDSSSSESVGVGMSLDFKDGKLVVKKLQEGGPAARCGESTPRLHNLSPISFLLQPDAFPHPSVFQA
jgi:hypothetical protein